MTRRFLTSVTLPADPTVALEAATKQYVDNKAVSPQTPQVQVVAALPGTLAANTLYVVVGGVAP